MTPVARRTFSTPETTQGERPTSTDNLSDIFSAKSKFWSYIIRHFITVTPYHITGDRLSTQAAPSTV